MHQMQEKGTVAERLQALIDHFARGNKSAFGRAADLPSALLASIVGGRQSKPSFEVLQKILAAYPTVSPDWVLFGSGPMLRSENSKSEPALSNDISSSESLEEVVKQLVAAELNRRHMDGQVSAAWAMQSGAIQQEINQLVKQGHALIMQMHDIMINKHQSEEDKVRYIEMHTENERITAEIHRKRFEARAIGQAEIQAVQEAQATVYRIDGEPDPSRPFGGLLAYRLGISQMAAQQLVTTEKIRSVQIEGEGYRVSEQAVREFLGESSFHMIIPSDVSALTA